MSHKLINKSGRDMTEVEGFVDKFYPYAQERLSIDRPVTIILRSDSENAKKILGKTGYYDPEYNEVVIYVDDRHPKDILRSISHELIHHAQNCRGDLASDGETDLGYAQKDDHMRKMEIEAYLLSNGDDLMVFRDFEDNLKNGSNLMSEHTKEDLQKKIREIVEETPAVQQPTQQPVPQAPEPRVSDKEWYLRSLYHKLAQKWSK
jgi:hypothetical protein